MNRPTQTSKLLLNNLRNIDKVHDRVISGKGRWVRRGEC
jgi:hypothetical protein